MFLYITDDEAAKEKTRREQELQKAADARRSVSSAAPAAKPGAAAPEKKPADAPLQKAADAPPSH
jgi:hypothetical protein